MDYSRHTRLEFRRKFFKIFGAVINVADTDSGAEFGYIELKAWKLREDIRLYSDKTKNHELLRIHARNIIDFGATYDVYESSTDKLLYSLRRKGLASTFVRDRWEIYNADETQVALLQETSSGLALVRRYVGIIPIAGPIADLALAFAPLTYTVSNIVGGAVGGTGAKLTHRRNPLVVKMNLELTPAEAPLDPRIGVSLTALLSVIDANKN